MLAMMMVLRLCSVLLLAGSPPPGDACVLLTAQEIDAALGRSGTTPGQSKGGPGQPSQCRFANSPAGDVTVMLTPSSSSAKEDHSLRPDILRDEKTPVERMAGVGDSAYYWADSIEVLAGDRILTVWMHRTPQSVPAEKAKTGLIAMARQALGRLRALQR